jgi:hypothetical protein
VRIDSFPNAAFCHNKKVLTRPAFKVQIFPIHYAWLCNLKGAELFMGMSFTNARPGDGTWVGVLKPSSLRQRFASCSPFTVALSGTLMVLSVGLVDFLTGAEISFSVFYLIPIGFTTWFAGRALGLLTAFLSAAVWLAADLATTPGYSHPAIPYWNSLVRLGIFALTAHQLSAIRGLEQAVQKKTALLACGHSFRVGRQSLRQPAAFHGAFVGHPLAETRRS